MEGRPRPYDPAMAQTVPGDSQPLIIVPVYNDWSSLLQLAMEISALPGPRPRLILVDDGSTQSGPDIQSLERTGLAGDILRLRRNFGHQQAIAVGLYHAVARGGGNPMVIMDGDGEDRPENVTRLLARLAERPQSIVVAERARRHAPIGFRLFYRLYGSIFRLLTGQRLGYGNFCALGLAPARRLTRMHELNLHLAATVLRSRMPIERLPIDRGARYDGRSKMNFVDLTSHGLRSIAVFGETVLTRIVIGSFWLALFGALVVFVVFTMKLLGIASPGWATTVAGAVLVIVAQIAMTGLLGLFVVLRGQRIAALYPQAAAAALIERIDNFGGQSAPA